jgi:transposase-like protein
VRSPHFEDVYGATVSKDPIGRITDTVLGEMAEWQNRPLGQIDGGWSRLGSNQ